MSSASEEEALADLIALVARAEGLEVTDELPPEVRNNMATVHCVGGTPTEFEFRVSVYARGGQATLNQKVLREARVAIEHELADEAQFGPSQWRYEWIDGTDAWVCIFELASGREDI